MKVDIYTSTKNGEKYLTVAKGTKLESLQLPEDIDPDLLILSPFRTRLEINPEKEHKALDGVDVVKQINANGYAIHGAKTAIKLG